MEGSILGSGSDCRLAPWWSGIQRPCKAKSLHGALFSLASQQFRQRGYPHASLQYEQGTFVPGANEFRFLRSKDTDKVLT